MIKRPRAHELEDLSRNKLHQAFNSVGWTVEDLGKDYGEDCLVRVFENGVATPFTFFVQAKSSDHIESYIDKERRHVTYPVATDHIEHWKKFWEPVILTVWDSVNDVTYWESIQTFMEGHASGPLAKTMRVKVPIDNTLDEEGLKRILARTKSRHYRFEQEQVGAKILIDLLEKELDITISYDAQAGILFITEKDGSAKLIAFGRYAEQVNRLAISLGVSHERVIEESVSFMRKTVEAFSEGSELVVASSEGTILQRFPSLEDLLRHVERAAEVGDEEE